MEIVRYYDMLFVYVGSYFKYPTEHLRLSGRLPTNKMPRMEVSRRKKYI